MRRILVPLDESPLAESILPDAQRVAGSDGELVLMRDVIWIQYEPETGHYTYRQATDEAARYLENLATRLRREGVRVLTHHETTVDIPWAIDAAALCFQVDMVACATHGRSPLGRFLSGGVAWKALTNSPVPILLRHVDGAEMGEEPAQRRILVPLDGSALAEAALPLAGQLASGWKAPLRLVQVVPDYPIPDAPFHRSGMLPSGLADEITEARAYLDRLAQGLPCEGDSQVLAGGPVAASLTQAVEDWGITDVVLASHGRTGLERVILGSVADELVHRLHCPIIVIPVLAARRLGQAREAQAADARAPFA